MFHSRFLRLIVLLLTLLVALTSSKSVLAHAVLVRSEPADGPALSTAPAEFHLWFNEVIAAGFSSVQVLDPRGQSVTGITVRADPGERAALLVDLPTLPSGAYTLIWKTLSEADGHFSQGMVLFGVNVAAPTDPVVNVDNGTAPWSEIMLRWLNYMSLAGVVGALAVGMFLYRPQFLGDEPGRATSWRQVQRRIFGVAAWCVAVALLTGIGLLVRQIYTSLQTTPGAATWWNAGWLILTQTRWGALWLARQGLLLLLAGLFYRQRDSAVIFQAKRWRSGLAVTACAGLLVVQALMGHAAGDTRNAWLAVPVTALHLLAASLWVGGLAALVVGWLPLILRQQGRRSELLWIGFHPFSRLAAVSVGLLIVTGLYNTGQQIPSLDALILTAYGRSFLSKIGLLLIAGTIGLINTTLLHPSVAAPLARCLGRPAGWRPVAMHRLPVLVMVEVAFGAAILLFTGMMTANAPPRGFEFTLAPEDEHTVMNTTVDNLQVALEIKPNRPGQNVFSVRSVSELDPPPAKITRVSLQFTYLDDDLGRVKARAEEIEPGRYLLNGNYLKLAGPWQIDVVTRRHGMEDSVARFNWVVMPASALPPTVLSKRPLATPLTVAALVVLLMVALSLFALRWRALWRLPRLSNGASDPTTYRRSRRSIQVDDSPPVG